ncbi:protease [Sulfurospirillum diekertiae]|uniref:Protease n=1 Tax=Sulfurospirillum diekertiae TaxID=1854492 RepID=A0A290HVN8_9BACT|nr:hypothetical protein [Sulfurospirillum diekertiae]ATB69906.1 protease [Sulfurospirillum diekertiae]
MLEFIILIYILYLLIKMYAAFMEIGFVTQARILKAIILSPSNYAKAAAYKIASQKLSLVSSFFDFILFFGWIAFGLTALEATVHIGNEAVRSVLFVMSFIAINYVLLLPFDLYQTFGLDKKFGFSTINVKTFVLDQIKSILMFILFGGHFFGL